MSSFGALIASPIMQFIYSLIQGGEQKKAQGQADAATEQQYEDALRVFFDRAQRGLETFDQGSADAIGSLQKSALDYGAAGHESANEYERSRMGALNQFDRDTGDIVPGFGAALQQILGGVNAQQGQLESGYRDRYSAAERELGTYGRQAREDINERYDALGESRLADMVGRGLISTTATNAPAFLTERERSRELRGLDEDVARNRINVLSGLSGDELAARERGLERGAGYNLSGLQTSTALQSDLQRARSSLDSLFRGEGLAAQERGDTNRINQQSNIGTLLANMAQNRAGLFSDLYGDYGNVITGRNNIPPPQNNLGFLYGQNAVAPPSAPSWWDQNSGSLIGALIGAAGNIASAGLGSQGLSGVHPASVRSDVHSKENITVLDDAESLNRLSEVPVYRWRYKGDKESHVGPMAQDFNRSLWGEERTEISVIDAIGALISSVRALAAKVSALEAKNGNQ